MPERTGPDAIVLDAAQRAVVELEAGGCALVVGAPGSGKTTALVELLARRVEAGLASHEVLVLAAGRSQAAALRERIAARVNAVSTGPWARTAMSVAFEAVTARARTEGVPPPRLLSGPEHDAVIRELIEGQLADGVGPHWPEQLDATVRRLPAFRTELRDLMMRMTEYGVGPEELAAHGRADARPEWVAASEFLVHYAEIVAQAHPGRFDPAELTAFAERAVRDGVCGERLSAVRLVLVDDLQQATEGTLRLLRAFADAGAELVAFGDPDLAANTFRGAGAEVVSAFRARMGAPDAPAIVLTRVHRHGSALRSLVGAVTAAIGTAGQWQQRLAASELADSLDPAPAGTILQPSSWALSGAIARELRERHVFDGVPWSALAVVVRSRAEIVELERRLASGQVPTRVAASGRPLREHPEAAALLRILEVVVGRVALDGDLAAELLGGPFGGLDALALRRLRLALRAEALTGDDTRGSGELLAEALAQRGGFATIDHATGRRAERFAGLLATARAAHDRGASAEELLWEAWNASGVAEAWRAVALGTGVAADESNRALDGVVALFAAARRFSESRPLATVEDFLAEVLDAVIPEDTLAPHALDDAVLLTTPAGIVGFEFDTVVVTGLQDGRWPDLRIRGSLLGAPQFVDALRGVDVPGLDLRRLVLDDELRMLAVAVSRARRRVVLAAVDSDEEQPSPVIRMLAPYAPVYEARTLPLTLRALVGRLRRTLTWVGGDGLSLGQRERAEAAAALALLAREGMPGASPDDWRGLLPVSTDQPLVDLSVPGNRVRVSPSKLEAVQRAPMEWFVETNAGGGSGLSAGFGTLVHAVFEDADTPQAQQVEAMWAALRERWPELEFPSAWIGQQQLRAARQAIEALAQYLADQRESGVVRVSAEQTFEVDEEPATLSGKIDRVESHDGRIVIVDLKTGKLRGKAEVLTDPQLAAYQLAYERDKIENLPVGHEPGGASLLFSRSTTADKPYTLVHQPPITAERLEDFVRAVREAAVTMVGPQFDAVRVDDPFQFRGRDIRAVHLPSEVSSD